MKESGIKSVKKDFRLDFLGIGVAKSGSTWLADMLRLHPQIYIPAEKSIYYFNRYREKTLEPNLKHKKPLDWYHSFFGKAALDRVSGEICPEYLIQENCAADIFAYHPRIKLLVTLRDPVQRTYSQYWFRQQTGLDKPASFEAALREYPTLLDSSLYYKHLKRYFDLFPRENIRVLFYEDLLKDSRAYYGSVLSFLGVDEYYPEELGGKSNVTMKIRSRILGKLMTSIDLYFRQRPAWRWLRTVAGSIALDKAARAITKANKKSALSKPPLKEDLANRLREYFAEDIENLEKLLQKDLSHWKYHGRIHCGRGSGGPDPVPSASFHRPRSRFRRISSRRMSSR